MALVRAYTGADPTSYTVDDFARYAGEAVWLEYYRATLVTDAVEAGVCRAISKMFPQKK